MMRSVLVVALVLFSACASGQQPAQPAPVATADASIAPRTLFSEADASLPTKVVELDAAAAVPQAASTDPMELHHMDREGLLALVGIKEEASNKAFLDATFGTDLNARKMSQGNKAIARHTISKEKCLEGLRANNIVVQTAEQRATCNGFENMVPVWQKGEKPSYCIDVFEFPNKTCELPFVWTPPTWAKKVCEAQGKRLCSDQEWNVACRADPQGGPDQKYAYGEKLDLEICNTNLAHRTACNPRGSSTAWGTCSTDTEPSGAFPKCRSRFGVFDQHGNVAEVMTRKDGPRDTVTQLKGSAWFYVELAKEPGQPIPSTTMNKEGAYPDHCNFDPRWHVEPIDAAGHINYHLGFRCCRSVEQAR